MEDVEEVQEWIGMSIMSQFNDDREALLHSIQEETQRKDTSLKGYEYEDVAIGGWYFYSLSS